MSGRGSWEVYFCVQDLKSPASWTRERCSWGRRPIIHSCLFFSCLPLTAIDCVIAKLSCLFLRWRISRCACIAHSRQVYLNSWGTYDGSHNEYNDYIGEKGRWVSLESSSSCDRNEGLLLLCCFIPNLWSSSSVCISMSQKKTFLSWLFPGLDCFLN